MEDVPLTGPVGGGGALGGTRGTGKSAGSGTDRKALVQKWGNSSMVRTHSFLAAVSQIVQWSSEIDVTKVNIIGDMHSGKTTLAEAICHAFHDQMEANYGIPFAVRLLTAEDLANFKDTLAKLAPQNYALIFDDVSFMESTLGRKQIASIQAAVTTIRHMGGVDKKILLIYNFHYNMALNKFLRQSDFKFWTTVGSSERDNMERILKSGRAMSTVQAFQKWRAGAVTSKSWTVPYGKGGRHTYKWRNPFIPVLFYDNVYLRPIVTPTRDWMAPQCPTCYDGLHPGTRPNEISPEDYVAKGRKAYGAGAFNSAAKLILLENGLSTYSRAVQIAKRSIEKDLRVKQLSLEDLMSAGGFRLQKHRLRAHFSSFIDAVETVDKDKDKKDDDKDKDGSASGAGAPPDAPPPPPDAITVEPVGGGGTSPLPPII